MKNEYVSKQKLIKDLQSTCEECYFSNHAGKCFKNCQTNKIIKKIKRERAEEVRPAYGQTDIYVKDRDTGQIRRVGDDRHDMLMINERGQLFYHNLQNGEGCWIGNDDFEDDGSGFAFVINEDENGYACDPRENPEEIRLAVQVRRGKGRWIPEGDMLVSCSECGHLEYADNPYKYCCECGARMGGEVHEEETQL